MECSPEDVFSKIKAITETMHQARQLDIAKNINVEQFRDLISCYQKLDRLKRTVTSKHEDLILSLNDIIRDILLKCDLSFKCQIVGTKTYCLGYSVLYDPVTLLKKCTQILLCNVKKETDERAMENIIDVNRQDVFVVCVCLGLLELNNRIWSHDKSLSKDVLLDVLFPICEAISRRYTSATLLAFKCLVNIFHRLETVTSNYFLPDEYMLRIMDIVMPNWENPLTGVREQNSLLFSKFISFTNEKQWKKLVSYDHGQCADSPKTQLSTLLNLIMTQQTWMMKSKYFLLSAVFNKFNTSEFLKFHEVELREGLKVSLEYTHLASAGAELQQSFLSRLSEEEWIEFSMPLLGDVLGTGENELMKQNIFNYWLPNTFKVYPKFYDQLFTFLNENCSFTNVTSVIALMKIGRKEGYIKWEACKDSNFLAIALVHSDEMIRSDAFAVICVTRFTEQPCSNEIEKIKTFLIENINFDSARLRQSILTSSTTFVVRMRDSILLEMKRKREKDCDNVNVNIILDFLCWLHTFLIENLEDGCNYQRKYTSLLLYDAVLTHFAGSNCGSRVQRKSNNKSKSFAVKEFMERRNKWNYTSKSSRAILLACITDPSDTVRSSSVDILCSYFSYGDEDLADAISVYDKGKRLCSDTFFYQAESGTLLIKTVAVLVYKNRSEEKRNVLTERLCGSSLVLKDLLRVAQEQSKILTVDILKAASTGSPFHGVLGAIIALLTDEDSPEFGALSNEEMERLLSLAETIVDKMLLALSSSSNRIADFAPSFAEMGESIDTVARRSEVFSEADEELLQLSAAHQLALNCIWLNLKACCSLASKLVVTNLLEDVPFIERCMAVLVSVLKRCRHKGAIESGGLAIMNATKQLTTHNNTQLQQLPDKILGEIFDQVVANTDATVSRRSAGLSIMVHRIIAGDARENKPLLHKHLLKLLEIANEDVTDTSKVVDLPQASSLHFLSTLVQDSMLRQGVTHHMHNISMLCFGKLSSPLWTVRNGALQLFGALLPKLIGQKKHQDDENSSENYTIAFEELYFHNQPLFQLMEKYLTASSVGGDVIKHSQLMPLLTLLSNLTVTMHVFINPDLDSVINRFVAHMEVLFSSAIHDVRKLSAKTCAWLCIPSKVPGEIIAQTQQIIEELKRGSSQNRLHGLSLNVRYLLARFYKLKSTLSYLKDSEKDINVSIKTLYEVVKSRNVSCFVETIILKMLYMNKFEYLGIEDCNKMLTFFQTREKEPRNIIGMSTWYGAQVKIIVMTCPFSKLSSVVRFFLLNSTVSDINISCIETLRKRFSRTNCTEDDENYFPIDALLDFIKTRNENEIVERVLDVLKYAVRKRIVDRSNEQSSFIHEYVLEDFKKGMKCAGLGLPIVCGLLSTEMDISFVVNVVELLSSWSVPEEHNENLRMSSAESLKMLTPYLNVTISDEIGMLVWTSACNLLQDEDIDVRIEVSNFCADFLQLCATQTTINPFISLREIFKLNRMRKFMTEMTAVHCLWRMLYVKCTGPVVGDSSNIKNPFDHGQSNVYKEDVKLVDMIYDELVNLNNPSLLHKQLSASESERVNFKTIEFERSVLLDNKRLKYVDILLKMCKLA